MIVMINGPLDLGLPIYAFRLVCAPEEIERRVRRRNLPDLDYELQRARELVDILDHAARTATLARRSIPPA